MWQMNLASALLLIAAPVAMAIPQAEPFGSFGSTIEQAQKTDFFQFFHLEQTGKSKQGDATIITFQPSGEKFHELVRVNMTLSGKEGLIAAELVLRRSFVESGSDGIFARDIAKSFLNAGVNPKDQDRIAGLTSEIDQLVGTQSAVLVSPNAVKPAPSGPPSDGYLVYLGQRDAFQIALAHGQKFSLQNSAGEKTDGGSRVVRIAFRM